MKRMTIAAMVCLGMFGLAMQSYAQGTLSQAPRKPVSGIPSKFGLLQAPIDMSHLVPPITILAPPPVAWDWRDLAHLGVTPVKDQNPYGTCWAFAATGCLESQVLLDEIITDDYSEMELVHCNASGLDCDTGGNAYYATFYYSQAGTAQESCNQYIPYVTDCDAATCKDCPLLKQVSAWEQVCDSPDTAAIKDALYNIGPVYTSMYASGPGFSTYNGSYVIDNTSCPGTDHAVLIVGYDDDMGDDGAWIVKNSWGTDWGDNGYFYIAYGSWCIGSGSSVYSGYRNFPANQKVMTYENDVPWGSLGYGDEHDWGAVRFTPTLTGSLTHVGFWARAAGTSYTIKIFDNWNSGSPTVQKNTTQSGTLTRAGYYTLELTSPVPVTNADEIVLIIELTTPGYIYPIPVDDVTPFETNKSYVSNTGANGSWLLVDNGGSTVYGDVAFRAYIVPTTCAIPQKLGPDLRVTSNASNSVSPSLAWTGSEFGVSWYDYRNGNYEIYFVRVSSSGAKLGTDLRVTSAANTSEYPSLAWTGSEFGVSWEDWRDGNVEIYFARVSSAGAKIGTDLRVTSDASISEYPSLTWTGSEFGVSWDDGRDGNYEIYFARVSSSGAKIGSDFGVTSDTSDSWSPSLAWTGSEFGVSWEDYRDGNVEIYFALVSSSGSKLGSDLRLTSDALNSSSPSLAWTGSEFGVSWNDYRDGNYEIYFARISSSGSKLGSDLRVTSNASDSGFPSLAWTGSEFGVSWVDSRDGNSEIYFARVSSSGAKLGSDLRVTSNASSSIYSSLAWTGSEFGLSWNDNRDGNYEIYFARIGCGNCNLTGLDIIPVASQAGGTINLTEGAGQSFTAACTYTGATCGVLSDNCGQGQGVNWLYSGQVSLSTLGPSTSAIATANQILGPNGGSGQVSGLAAYGAGSFSDSTDINITNDDVYLGHTCLVPLVEVYENDLAFYNIYGTWSDGYTENVTAGTNVSGDCTGGDGVINADDVPCGAGGTCTISDPACAPVPIINDDTVSTVSVTPAGPLDKLPSETEDFYCVGSWNDGCTNSETNPKGTAPVYSLGQDQSGASIIASTGFYTAGAIAPSIDSAVCTISGVSDSATINVVVSGDSDGDGLPDDWENTYDCMMANTVDNLEDYDSDGLNNEQEYAAGTHPCDADTDNDGASDGAEALTYGTDPLDPDSDGDLMFDGWEIAGASCGLDPLFIGDAWLDSDTDTLENIHEFFNNNGDGNVSDPCDDTKPRQGWPGGGYFGDGDGNLLIGVPDLNRINLILNGRSADYNNAFPADPVIQDMDGNLIIGVPDKNLISLILNGKLGGIIAGTPTELSLVAPIGGATVAEGDTVRIQVKLTKDLTKPRAGFGVVFTIVSGAGTLLGGEGISGSGRYDLTALDGVAQLVVRVDGTESILVEVALPYDPEVHTQALALTPDPSVLINVE